MSTAKRKFERTHTIADARKNLKCKAKQIKWIGDREDLGLVKGKTYTYKELGATVGIVSHSMRGRLRGSSEASDCHMWANGEISMKLGLSIKLDVKDRQRATV